MKQVKLNGKVIEVAEGESLYNLLERVNLLNGKFAVEVDEEVVSKSSYNNITVKDGMVIEVIAFVGGG